VSAISRRVPILTRHSWRLIRFCRARIYFRSFILILPKRFWILGGSDASTYYNIWSIIATTCTASVYPSYSLEAMKTRSWISQLLIIGSTQYRTQPPPHLNRLCVQGCSHPNSSSSRPNPIPCMLSGRTLGRSSRKIFDCIARGPSSGST
jgi:hypothetical protein